VALFFAYSVYLCLKAPPAHGHDGMVSYWQEDDSSEEKISSDEETDEEKEVRFRIFRKILMLN
jgi:hypothetical protein